MWNVAATNSDRVLWVVLRLDLFLGPLNLQRPRRPITLRAAVPTMEEAEAEAVRLNRLRDDNGEVVYFTAPVRWFPEGRGVEVRY